MKLRGGKNGNKMNKEQQQKKLEQGNTESKHFKK